MTTSRPRTSATRVVVPAGVMNAVADALKVMPAAPQSLEKFLEALRVTPAVAALRPSDEVLLAALERLDASGGNLTRFVLPRQGRHSASASASA